MKRRRKRRSGEVNCTCGAYPFVHRMMGGDCNGAAFIREVFEMQMYGACRDCHFRTEDFQCEVLEGQDATTQCPELQEHIRYHGIKLYGMAKPRRSS